jgi:SAM-dependent MidA family methyltransferase
MNEHDDRWQESNPELVAVIRDEILDAGPIRFDRFMELALYHEPHGYYRSVRPRPGRTGDFLTAPEAHPIFGATLAAQVVDFDESLDHPDRFTIIEYGAGAGLLIRPLLSELRQQHPGLYERTVYRPVELNPIRLAELRDHLNAGGHGERLQPELAANPAAGCALANEFLDALPTRRFTRVDGDLREVFVTWRDDWFAEELRSTDDSEVLAYLRRHGFELDAGDWIEFHPGIGTWLDEISQILERGFLLVIDYGYPANELFSHHRRRGTLKAYYQHGASEEFFRGIGEQDLTAHVNFSEVEYQASQRGFHGFGITTQADLLAALGIGERLMRLQQQEGLSAEDYLGVRSAVLRMIDPGAMGRFRALFLGRGVDHQSRLRGLQLG